MEITFQNKRQDFEAFYDYMVTQTQQGKILSAQVYRTRQVWIFLWVILFGSLFWGITGQWKFGVLVCLVLLIITEVMGLLISGFKPRYYEGKQIYKRQEKSITLKELQVFELPRTLSADENWLEIRNSEAIHRWRWRRVDEIGLTPNFIFIHVGSCPVVYVPKRDFSSEQSFIEFGDRLAELKEKYKDQPIGAE